MAGLSTDKVLQVELVAADRLVWSGQATMVIARTTEGDVGILPNHAPLLSSIIEGVVDVQTVEGETWVAAVDAGFLSVADNRVSILSERAGRKFRDRVSIALESHVARLQAMVPTVEHHERPEYLDRLAMLRYGVSDLRLFFDGDLRFLSQFK